MEVRFVRCSHEDLYSKQKDMLNGSIIVCPDVSRMYVKMDDKILPMTLKWTKWTKKYTLKKCICCGAPLPQTDDFIVKCEYCGNVYDVDEEREI